MYSCLNGSQIISPSAKKLSLKGAGRASPFWKSQLPYLTPYNHWLIYTYLQFYRLIARHPMSVSYCLLNFLSPSSGFYLKTGCMKHCFSALVQSFSYRDVVTLFCGKLLCFESLVAKLSHYNSFFFSKSLSS